MAFKTLPLFRSRLVFCESFSKRESCFLNGISCHQDINYFFNLTVLSYCFSNCRDGMMNCEENNIGMHSLYDIQPWAPQWNDNSLKGCVCSCKQPGKIAILSVQLQHKLGNNSPLLKVAVQCAKGLPLHPTAVAEVSLREENFHHFPQGKIQILQWSFWKLC